MTTALAQFAHEAPHLKIYEWEESIAVIHGITKITKQSLASFINCISNFRDEDTYMTSAMYYLFTGRNGLWMYTHENEAIIFCWNPNVDGEIVIFAPTSKTAYSAFEKLISQIPTPPNGIKIGRIKDDAKHHFPLSTHAFTLEPTKEEVLDWLYPVRILSTRDVSLAKGNKYRNVRKSLIHMQSILVEKRSIDIQSFRQELNFLLHRWAQHFSKSKTEYADIFETYDSLFRLSSEHPYAHNLAYFINGTLEGISIWDSPPKEGDTANLYCNFCSPVFNGLSDVMVVSVCELLASQNISFLNMGGSETETLDFFKNKFRPAMSISMHSSRAHKNTVDALPIQLSTKRHA